MPEIKTTCAYGGFPIAAHWTFGQSPPLPPEWVQSWTGQVLGQFPEPLRPKVLALLQRLKGVYAWSTDRPDKPRELADHPERGGWYCPDTAEIYLNSDKANKAIFSHEVGHHLIRCLEEYLATAFANTFGELDNVEPAPGASGLFTWAVAQGGA